MLTAFLLENCLPANYKASFTDRETLKATIANAKTVSNPSAALTEAIAFAEMEIACNTTDAYRLGVRKTALENAMNGTVVGLNLMPVQGVTQTPYSGDIHYIWPYYSNADSVTLYKGGEGHYWPYVHTEYNQLLNVNATPYLTVDASTTADWNVHIAYIDKNGTRQTVTASQAHGKGAADFAAQLTRTTYTIDFGGYVKAQGHADANGYVTVVGCDIYVVGVADTYVQLYSCAFTAAADEPDAPAKITGAYTVTNGLLQCLPVNTTATKLLAAMDNADYLRIVDKNGAAAGETLATGMKLQLVVNGTVVDEAIIAVCGDVNGDGIVNTMDARAMLASTLQGGMSIDTAAGLAMDINGDGSVNTMDVRVLLKGFVA